MNITVQGAYEASSRLAAVWVIISALEGLVTLTDYDSGGPFDARVIGVTRQGTGTKWRSTVFGSREAMRVVLYLRLLAGLVLIAIPFLHWAMVSGWVVVAATNLFARWRRLFGDDGSDQMLTIVSVAFALTLIVGTNGDEWALGLYFVGAQGILAYVTAGIAKLVSPQWRSGIAIQGIFATRTYGTRSVATVVRRTKLASVVAWSTIGFETAFVAAAFLPQPTLLVLLTIGAAFHVGSAVIMGLNGFVWAFICTYPPILYLNQEVRALLF